ncbi:MAG: aldehyde dehydrogenase family protein, partial [Deltaproteobacteria bacterium]|nr:aldehyde dehydrogenase family protein [Deltaproteobacteria bacterium]
MKGRKTKGQTEGGSKSNEIVSINPTTEKVLGRVRSVGRRGVKQAMTQATQAFQGWSRLPVRQRQEYLKRLSEVIVSRKRDIAKLIAQEQGKPMTEAMGTEVLPVLGILKDLYRNAHKVLRSVAADH